MKEKKRYIVCSFNLEPEVWEKVKEQARKDERKAADQLRFIVKKYLGMA